MFVVDILAEVNLRVSLDNNSIQTEQGRTDDSKHIKWGLLSSLLPQRSEGLVLMVEAWLSQHKLEGKPWINVLINKLPAFLEEAGFGVVFPIAVNQEHSDKMIFKASESLIINKLIMKLFVPVVTGWVEWDP